MQNITTIFTIDQIDALNQYQVGVQSIFPKHPFTCPSRSDGVTYPKGIRDDSRATHGSEGGDLGLLVATDSGWICPHCGYTQNWAHESMYLTPPSLSKDERTSSFYALGRDPSVVLLERTDIVILQYTALYDSAKARQVERIEGCEKSERILRVVSFMLESLHRRRTQLIG